MTKKLFCLFLACCMVLVILPMPSVVAKDVESDAELNVSENSAVDLFSDDLLSTDETSGDISAAYCTFNPADAHTKVEKELDLGTSDKSTSCFDLVAHTLSVQLLAEGEQEAKTKRYMVLVLDTSSSQNFIGSDGSVFYTADTAVEYVKTAAKKFIQDVSSAKGTNYIAVVTFAGATAKTISSFTTDLDALIASIDSVNESEHNRNVAAGLQAADSLISSIEDDSALKNVILFTTGMTDAGSYDYNGHYGEDTIASDWRRMDTQIRLYAYANVAHRVAEALKAKATLYTIGLFQVMENMPSQGRNVVDFFKLSASDWATSSDHFRDVGDPSELEFVFGEVADDIVNGLKEIVFKYQSGGKDHSARCYYTDDYFAKNSYDQGPKPNDPNPSLATMSLSFAMSAFGSDDETDYANKSINAQNLLKEIGVPPENIGTNEWFTKKPQIDSIAVIVGHKEITVNDQQYTLIAIAVRGGGYEQEWGSNFTLGTVDQHEGFNTAKNNVLDYLRDYVKEHNITGNVKLWMTGYSRAAATANLLAGDLDNGAVISDQISYERKDIFAYCFETPAGALVHEVRGRDIYKNIFNIVNQSDPVPYVAPAALNFGRYGIDKYLPSPQSSTTYATDLEKMLKVYSSLPSTEEYIVDNFQMKKIAGLKNWLPFGEKIGLDIQDDTKNNYSQGVFLSNYVTILAKDFMRSRSNYVLAYQDEIREICSVVFGCSSTQLKALTDSIVEQASNHWGDLVKSYIWNVGINPRGTEDDALQIVSDWLNKAIQDANITEYSQETIDRAGKDLGDLMLALISNHPNYFTTLVLNIKGIGSAHFPELCWSWLASMDENYNKQNTMSFNNGSFRIIRINCDVDVQVVNSAGNVVSSIVNENPVELSESSIISGINEDGEKFIILPVDSSYDVNITARSDDLVNYGIDEYCALAGDFTRAVDYFNVELLEGQSLNGEVPTYSSTEIENDTPDGSTAQYTLIDTEHNIIESSSDLSGDEATNAYYNVEVSSSDDNQGIVIGSGLRQFGNFAEVEAIPNEHFKFAGWFDGDNKISDDEIYRFSVTKDVSLVAKFNFSDNIYTVTFANGGGTGSMSSVSVTTGSSLTLPPCTFTAPAGQQFKSWSINGTEYVPGDSYTFNEDTVVTAVWKTTFVESSGSSGGGSSSNSRPYYRITLPKNFVGGKITSNVGSAISGKTITLTVTPDSNYKLNTLDVTNAKKQQITLNNTGDGIYTFSMPSSNVTVSASFVSDESPVPYQIAITQSMGGMVSVSQSTAYAGDTVTISVLPNDGYEFQYYLISDESENVLITCTELSFAMPSTNVTIAPVFQRQQNPFIDVKVGAYYEAILWAYKTNVTTGVTANTFAPNRTCSRAQAVTFLWRAAGSPEPSTSNNPFTDVQPSSYFYKAVLWATEKGITTGRNASTFAPDDFVSRANVVTFLYRMSGENIENYAEIFPDVSTNAYYSKAIVWASSKNIAQGFADSTFRPNDSCTRAQIVTFLYRFFV